MCGSRGGGSNEEAKQQAEERHQENLALQREQMAEQKRQFELSRQDNQRRYKKQERMAEADPPPRPEKTAGVAAPAIDSLKIQSTGKKKYTNPQPKKATRGGKPKTSFDAKNTYIV